MTDSIKSNHLGTTPPADAAVAGQAASGGVDHTQTFSIRDLCDEFDVTPRALRFYESEGLISPVRDGQRRIYSVRDRTRLKLVLRGKRFGFSLAEVRELLDLYYLGDGQLTQYRTTLNKAYEKLELLQQREQEIGIAIAELKERIERGEDLVKQREADAAFNDKA